jgi:hypothetical protein
MQRWSIEKANEWYRQQPWLIGCNFIPSTAINQLEMWQKDSFDPGTIDRELGWAADLGFNAVRVYLHDLAWQADPAGFKRRIEHYLEIASRRRIRTIFVFFDDCWWDDPRIGKQPQPRPGVHNSGWLQSPGSKAIAEPQRWGRLKAYVQDIVRAFAKDERVLMWDLYNEVGNNYLPVMSLPQPVKTIKLLGRFTGNRLRPIPSLPLLKKAFEWARAADPDQPLTSSIWFSDQRLNHYILETVDVITFHNYKDVDNLRRQIDQLKAYGRPLICTEFMARSDNSLFTTHLPIFKQENVGCFNWGLVSGKTQTIYPWNSLPGAQEPQIWFHDIFRKDGTPYSQAEIASIKQMTGK